VLKTSYEPSRLSRIEVANIVYNLDKKCYQIWIKPPFTFDQVKYILQKLIENDLHDVKAELK